MLCSKNNDAFMRQWVKYRSESEKIRRPFLHAWSHNTQYHLTSSLCIYTCMHVCHNSCMYHDKQVEYNYQNFQKGHFFCSHDVINSTSSFLALAASPRQLALPHCCM